MLTYTNLQEEYQKLTDDSAANITQGEAWLNDSIRTICNLQGGKLRFLEGTKDLYTVADQEGYQIPNGFRKLIQVTVYSDDGSSAAGRSTIYTPEMVFDPTKWTTILQARLGSSSTPYFTYVENQRFFIQPVPSVTGNLIRLRGRKLVAPINIADYTTGTITSVPYSTTFTAIVASGATSATLSGAWSLPTDTYQIKFSNGEFRAATFTNSSTSVTWEEETTSAATATITVNVEGGGSIVTGSGVTWTADMVGRYLYIPQTTAAGGGDGMWYEIGTYINSTTLGLLKPYEGTAISAGTASYTIGQVPIVPEAYQMGIVYRAAALYWDDKGSMEKAKRYWLKYDGGNEAGYSKDYGGFMLQMLSNEGETEEGSYVPPFGSTQNMPQYPYYFPFQDASGFN